MATQALTLYSITDEVQARLDSLDLCTTDEQRAELQRELDQWLEAQVRKVDGVAEYIRFLEAQAAYAKAEADRLSQRHRAIEAARERLEKYVIDIMERIDKKKLEGETSTLKLKACPSSVVIEDENLVPQKYKHVTVKTTAETWGMICAEILSSCEKDLSTMATVGYSTDKRALKKDLDAGVTIPGADTQLGGFRLEAK